MAKWVKTKEGYVNLDHVVAIEIIAERKDDSFDIVYKAFATIAGLPIRPILATTMFPETMKNMLEEMLGMDNATVAE